MSLFSIFDVAGSGMSAQSVRLNTTASNIANADSVSSSIDKTYRSRHPIFEAEMAKAQSQQQTSQGVTVRG
ncbi:flagellar basal body rod protein FlgC [Shewanella putrefaciens]|nr:flagellar basal body rod protein FlgC [Shewanella putrefaciens]